MIKMKNSILRYSIVSILLLIVLWWVLSNLTIFRGSQYDSGRVVSTMELRSTAFQYGEAIPSLYTCDAAGVNPPLTFSGIPKKAKSLVLIMEDIDVPETVRPDRVWNHWLLWNIDPSTVQILEGKGAELQAVSGITTSNTLEYVPPCPRVGQHRYVFTLYALDDMIQLPQGSSKEKLLDAMSGRILEQVALMGVYTRK